MLSAMLLFGVRTFLFVLNLQIRNKAIRRPALKFHQFSFQKQKNPLLKNKSGKIAMKKNITINSNIIGIVNLHINMGF